MDSRAPFGISGAGSSFSYFCCHWSGNFGSAEFRHDNKSIIANNPSRPKVLRRSIWINCNCASGLTLVIRRKDDGSVVVDEYH
jgi:hypothetical protein